MSSQRYTPEFKDEAVRQIVDRGYTVAEVQESLVLARQRQENTKLLSEFRESDVRTMLGNLCPTTWYRSVTRRSRGFRERKSIISSLTATTWNSTTGSLPAVALRWRPQGDSNPCCRRERPVS